MSSANSPNAEPITPKLSKLIYAADTIGIPTRKQGSRKPWTVTSTRSSLIQTTHSLTQVLLTITTGSASLVSSHSLNLRQLQNKPPLKQSNSIQLQLRLTPHWVSQLPVTISIGPLP